MDTKDIRYAIVLSGPTEFFGRIKNGFYHCYESDCYQLVEDKIKFEDITEKVIFISRKEYQERLNKHNQMLLASCA